MHEHDNGETSGFAQREGHAHDGEDGSSIEIIRPVRPAYDLLLGLIDEASTLEGLSVSITEAGTLLLNQPAWMRFRERLQAIEGLMTRHAYGIRTKPIRFLVAE